MLIIMKTKNILVLSIVFLLGFLSANLIGYYYFYGLEMPFSENFGLINSNSNQAPSNFINENQIEIYDNKVILNIQGAMISRYADTGSMEPTLDENSNGIKIIPSSEEDGILYFGPGIHKKEVIELYDNKMLYIAEGAILKAGIKARGKNIRILGRGI